MIREAVEEDLDAIMKMAVRVWPNGDVTRIKEWMLKGITAEKTYVLIYEMKDKNIGFVRCSLVHDLFRETKEDDLCRIEGIYVKEKYRRSGVAVELLDACEIWAKERGCAECVSACERFNTEAFLLHLNSGYDEVNRIIWFKKNI